MDMSNEQLVARIQAGEDVSGNMLKLWQQTERFIEKLAVKYQGYAEAEDLKQEGYIGLCEAVRQYNAEKGLPFVNYAAFWIKQAMRRYVDNCGSVIRVPVHAREWAGKYNRVVREYRKYYGEYPAEGALCALLDVGREKLYDIQDSVRMLQVSSLDEPAGGEDGDITLYDMAALEEDIEEDTVRRLDAADMGRELWEAVELLPDNLPEVIEKRYREGMTLTAVGRVMGTDAGEARRMHGKAILLLGKSCRTGKLRAYYEEYLAAGPIYHVGVESFQRTHMSAVERAVFGW